MIKYKRRDGKVVTRSRRSKYLDASPRWTEVQEPTTSQASATIETAPTNRQTAAVGHHREDPPPAADGASGGADAPGQGEAQGGSLKPQQGAQSSTGGNDGRD